MIAWRRPRASPGKCGYGSARRAKRSSPPISLSSPSFDDRSAPDRAPGRSRKERSMTNEERATNQVARWVSEARAALGLSRQEFGRLLAGADVPRTAAYRFERHGRIAQEELATVTKILHAALSDMERRVAAAGKLLGTV